MENTSDILTGRDLMRLKEEYAGAVVEKMTEREARAYLRQIIYNDIAVADGLELSQKICRTFGEKIYDQMVEDITTWLVERSVYINKQVASIFNR